MKINLIAFCALMLICLLPVASESLEQEIFLRDNMKRAQPGDYIVTAQNKNHTILLMRNKDTEYLQIEEITVPSNRTSGKNFSWRQWIENGAPGHTCWVLYTVQLRTGAIIQTFSFTKNEWITIPQSQNFMSTLLNLHFRLIPESERKKVGPPPASDSRDRRSIWQPPLIVESKIIPNIAFDGWRTRWPKDNSDLSGKIIEVYLPKENSKYPSYFPYWLQISGMIGKAKVRIVDSGSQLFSPARVPLHP